MKLRKKRKLSKLVTNKAVASDAPVVTNVYTEHASKNKAKLVRHETLNGVDHIVVSVVMMTEGVHTGSGGALLYNAEELAASAETYNHKPVCVYHPAKNGKGVSACSPEMLEAHQVGILLNTRFDDLGRLISEAWLLEDRMKKVDERVLKAVQNKEMLECSTGVFTDNEQTEGEWEGEEYKAIARNMRGDHLAILPDLKGACSIEDGAGFIRNELRSAFPKLSHEDIGILRTHVLNVLTSQKNKSAAIKSLLANEASHERIREALCEVIAKEYPQDEGYSYPWVESVYDQYFIYSINGRLFKSNYTSSDTGVRLSGESSPVIRVTEYKTASGLPVGNAESKPKNRGNTMNKEQLVADLIANHGYVESSRVMLMGLDEKTLNTMRDAAGIVANRAPKAEPKKEEPKQETAPVMPKMEQVLNAEQQAALSYGQRMLSENKTRLITKIKASPTNRFPDPVLNAKSIDDLEMIASLIPEAIVQNETFSQQNFRALGEVVPIVNASNQFKEEDALTMPDMFAKAK